MSDRWALLRAADEQRRRQAEAALRLGLAIGEARALADRYDVRPPFGFTRRTATELRESADRFERMAREEIARELGDAARIENLAGAMEAEVSYCRPLTPGEEADLRRELSA